MSKNWFGNIFQYCLDISLVLKKQVFKFIIQFWRIPSSQIIRFHSLAKSPKKLKQKTNINKQNKARIWFQPRICLHNMETLLLSCLWEPHFFIHKITFEPIESIEWRKSIDSKIETFPGFLQIVPHEIETECNL